MLPVILNIVLPQKINFLVILRMKFFSVLLFLPLSSEKCSLLSGSYLGQEA